jgi:hypothetical protein
MTWTPSFDLWNSTGTVLIYTFPAVNYTNAPQSVKANIEITSQRSSGSIIIPGGEKPWDLELRFNLIGDDYEEVAGKIDLLESTIDVNTPYLLRIDKSQSTYYEYKVKRLQPFNYAESLRNWLQEVTASFRVNCW